MTTHTSADWLLFYITLAVLAFFGITVKRTWDRPLHNGPDYFLGVKVRSGFYEGVGSRWLRGWHGVVLAWYSITLFAALAILIWGRWDLFPAWGGGTAVLYVASLLGFVWYARTKLGANPPVRATIAIPLEARRLSDYISWRVEALIGVITASSWALLLIHESAQLRWQVPVVMTYIIIGLFPFKIGIVREGFPIPAERPKEHLRYAEVVRRYGLFVMDCFRWVFVVALGAYALLQGWRVVGRSAWLHWFVIGFALVVYLYLVVIVIRGGRRMDTMGRDLVPPGSWSTPFRHARQKATGFTVGFGAWFTGLVLLLVFFHH